MEFQHFLAPVDDKNPSGVDLRNDARFHEIERLIAPAANGNRDVTDGTSADAAVSVDWEDVQSKLIDLAADGQDLRVLVVAVRAAYQTDLFAGLAEGLKALTSLLDQYWDTIHPELRDRPNPKDAALRRINALMQLENDESGLLGDMEYLPVFSVRGLGPVTGLDLEKGQLSADQVLREGPSGLGQDEQEALKEAHKERVNRVRASCRAYASENSDELESLRKDVAACQTALASLEATLAEKLDAKNGVGVKFGELTQFLERIMTTLESAGGEETDMAEQETATDTPAEPEPAAKTTGSGTLGPITSRKDVERHLDMIIAFYERTEPSSPIPHLARRMRRMVPMDFMELMNEIAPSGLKEFRNAAGVNEKK